jgi:hypothetical protein
MLPTDNAAAARSSAAQFEDPRVMQFWDPERLTGIAWSAQFQVAFVPALLDSLPPEEEMRPHLEQWVADPATRPAWDVAYFYPARAKWVDQVPKPQGWTKQVGFWGPDDPADSVEVTGGATGVFWTDRRPGQPIESDWMEEFALGMTRSFSAPDK